METNRDNPISHRMLLDNGQLFFLRVIHSKNNHPDIGEYYCNATNKHGTAISRIANIQIAGMVFCHLELKGFEDKYRIFVIQHKETPELSSLLEPLF